jgi:hypothetical protein
MSVKSDMLELERSRKREIAIREVLRNMQGGSEENLEPVTPEATEKNKQAVSEVTEETPEPLVLPAYDPLTSPARVVGAPQRPWMRGNVQWRPMTSREREAEEMAAFDVRMMKQWAAHGLKEQRSYDEKILLDARQAKRMAREKRTGLRRLNGDKLADEHFISMEEAQSRGLLSGGAVFGGGQGEE